MPWICSVTFAMTVVQKSLAVDGFCPGVLRCERDQIEPGLLVEDIRTGLLSTIPS